MRWVNWYPRNNDKRIVKKFALFPISIYNEFYRETRWLETVYIEQVFNSRHDSWFDRIFVTRDEYKGFKTNENT